MNDKRSLEMLNGPQVDSRDVIVKMNFGGGGEMRVRTSEERAQESLKHWKDSVRFYNGSIENIKATPEDKRPWYLYHFMIGDSSKPETLRPSCSVVLPSIIGMSYYMTPEEDHTHEKMLLAHTEMMKELKMFLRSELRDEAWRNPPPDEQGN